MGQVVLGVTGSVAAIRTPDLFDALRRHGHSVRVVVTEPSLYFFDHKDERFRGALFRDADEWPGTRYVRDATILHIELRNWADLLLAAPLDANTLAKFALGLNDTLLTSVYRAWNPARPRVLAPAMNTLMWESPVTRRHLRLIQEDYAEGQPADEVPGAPGDPALARLAPGLFLVPPQSKRLACGDVGMGAMADVETLAEAVDRVLDGRS